jgi:hypothetical protein
MMKKPRPTPKQPCRPIDDPALARVRGGQPAPQPTTVSASDDWMAPV